MTHSPEIALIAAMASDRLIGRDGSLPWHLPRDLRQFRELTMGHALIMGRKTFESIGRCLPGRLSIVLTRQLDFRADGAEVVRDWESAVRCVPSGRRAFVIGGAEIYQSALPRVSRMYLTFVEGEFAGDTYFPVIDWHEWQAVGEQSHPADAKNTHATRFVEFVRRPA